MFRLFPVGGQFQGGKMILYRVLRHPLVDTGKGWVVFYLPVASGLSANFVPQVPT